MYFSHIYQSWEGVQRQKYEKIFRFIGMNFLSGKVLDIGSGSGFLEKFLSDKNLNCKIVCLDINKTSKADVLGNGDDLPFRDECFDVVVSIDTMHLIKGNDFQRVLKKNGTMLLAAFFNDSNYVERKRVLLDRMNGFKIMHDFVIPGKENECVILGRKQ